MYIRILKFRILAKNTAKQEARDGEKKQQHSNIQLCGVIVNIYYYYHHMHCYR